MTKLFLILFVITGITIQAQTPGITQTDREINSQIFSGEWQQAKMQIEKQIQENPEHPKYYFMKAYMFYLSRYFANTGMSRDSTIKVVHYYSRKAIEKGEQLEETKEIKFYIGCAYGYLARAHGMWQEWWSAYWAASDCENYLEEVIEEDPEFYDAYFELGVIKYYPAVAITGFTSTLAWLGGMAGDRELGLQYLNLVADRGDLFKAEANVGLGIVYNNFENDPEIAANYYEKVIEEYPENNLAVNQKQRIEFMMLIDEKGVDYFVEKFDSLRVEYNINDPAYLNTMGYFLINRERLDDALVIFKFNLELYPHVANCYDSLAECFMTRNENEDAIKYYKLAYEKIPDDTTATEEFKEALKTGIEHRLEELEARIRS
jgi:tetratricopeptide (TPR) repeat protein